VSCRFFPQGKPDFFLVSGEKTAARDRRQEGKCALGEAWKRAISVAFAYQARVEENLLEKLC
jgi:hypothetical protein